MANLQLQPAWDAGVYQWEVDDEVEGGPTGKDNWPTKNLGNRSEFLKAQMDAAVGGNIAGPDGFGLKMLNGKADQVDSMGRDLLKVLGVTTIQAAIAALQAKCNGTGQPDFSGLMVGDYLNGIDLSAIPAENGGDAGQAWNASYKNNQIVLSGFNTFKHSGDTEVDKNHIGIGGTMCAANKRLLLYLLFALFFSCVVGALRAEQPDQWYLILESELQTIEAFKKNSEAEKQTWLSQVRELRTRAENSETRSAKLETESGSLNRQLTQAREEQRKLEQSFNEFEAEQSALLSLKNGEIASLIQEKADKTTLAERYKGKAETRLVMVIALAGAWVLFIGIKVCRFFRVLPF